jgi:hypothetical protein
LTIAPFIEKIKTGSMRGEGFVNIPSEVEDFIRAELESKMRDSKFVVMPFTPGMKTDIAFALQLGLCLLLEKPLIIAVMRGAYIPPRVLGLADEIVTGDSMEDLKKALGAAVNRLANGGHFEVEEPKS